MSEKNIQAEFEIVEPVINIPTFEVVDDNGVKKVEITGFDDPKVKPSDVAGREITVRKAIVLGNARININELTAYVESKIQSVAKIDVNTADEVEVKKAQSELNTLSKELNDSRIALDKEWKTPFENFIADPIKKLVKRIDDEKKPIADKIKSIKDSWEQERLKDIEEVKTERLAKEDEPVDKYIRTLPWFFDQKWLNKTTWGSNGNSATKVTKEIDDKVVGIVNDLNVIGMLNSDNPFGSQLMNEYKANEGDLAKTLLKKQELEEASKRYEEIQKQQAVKKETERLEQERLEAEAKEKRENARREESDKKEEPLVVHVGNVEPPSFFKEEVELPPENPDENKVKIYVTTFKVKSTYEELALIVGYMNQINVKSKMIESKLQEAE